jgi:hypothetical protein
MGGRVASQMPVLQVKPAVWWLQTLAARSYLHFRDGNAWARLQGGDRARAFPFRHGLCRGVRKREPSRGFRPGGEGDLTWSDSGGTRSARFRALCEAAVHTLPIAGASLTLTTAAGHRSLLAASDGVSARLDELHFTLGEGPAVDAVSRGHPVLAGDLAEPGAAAQWPAFGGAAMEAGAGAVFALPLQIGAVCLGVLVGYRVEPGRLSADDLAQALRLADGAADALLDLAAPASGLAQPDGDGDGGNHRTYSFGAEVHQASGMLMVQLGVSIEVALARLRAYAFAQGRPVSEIAREVVAGTLLLERQ